jgi:hypothetical protein
MPLGHHTQGGVSLGAKPISLFTRGGVGDRVLGVVDECGLVRRVAAQGAALLARQRRPIALAAMNIGKTSIHRLDNGCGNLSRVNRANEHLISVECAPELPTDPPSRLAHGASFLSVPTTGVAYCARSVAQSNSQY